MPPEMETGHKSQDRTSPLSSTVEDFSQGTSVSNPFPVTSSEPEHDTRDLEQSREDNTQSQLDDISDILPEHLTESIIIDT